MAGIYIHVPYCKQACHYCNFYFSTSLRSKNDFMGALLKEISLQSAYLSKEKIDTIYFGGGTPSLLSGKEIKDIFTQLRASYDISGTAEATLEANPDDLLPEKLEELKEAGINRLSIGIQSFFQEDLLWMNRAHTAEQSVACIKNAQAAGFYNLTIDLIYGTPGLTDAKWEANVQQAISLGIPHLSCYALTVEPRTALDHFIKAKSVKDIDPEQQARQFLLLMDWMEAAGYDHYEISNFAKPGWRSKHNSAYWQGKKYLGLGPSAHSFDGNTRQWNIANNAVYIQMLEKDMTPFEKEILSPTDKLNEYIMTSLRTMEGLDIDHVKDQFGIEAAERISGMSEVYINAGNMTMHHHKLQLTKKGKLLADGIASDMFS